MKTIALGGVGLLAVWLALTGNYKAVLASVGNGDFSGALSGRGEQIILGLIGASLIVWLIETNAGHAAASWFVFLLILGFVTYNRVSLQIFADALANRLKGTK